MFWPRLRREARPSARGAAFQTRQVTVHDTGKLLKEVDMLRDQLEASNLMVRQLAAGQGSRSNVRTGFPG